MSIPPPPSDPQQQPPYGGGYGYPPPPPGGPYPPQQPWAPYPPPQRPSLNALAVAALVLGILCLLPGVGLVLGLVALAQIRRRGERGKGMAITGAALSAVGLLLWTLFFTTGASDEFLDGVKEGVRESSTLYVPKGKCFNTPDGTSEGVMYDVDEVPCADAHEGEVFATFALPEGDFPGDNRLAEIADERCYGLRDDYAMDTWAVPDNVDVYYLVPIPSSWRLGDREVTCFFGHVDSGATLTGSLRADATTLDEHQVRYLTAERLLNEAMDAVPEAEYVEDDLPGHREWAREIEAALGEQTALLESHPWPAGAEEQVGDLVKDLEEARGAWGEAADATDADTYYVHMDKGFVMTDPERFVPSREALDLETTPPYTYEDDSGSGGGGSTGGGVDV
ncbi:DUF4190 domain-containing protein [Streptomyces sp. NPDC093252]|uniref:DUF4190 domain-containing protein n=1 Tax=Streptomyces sp. NPDC093252 TaxID=3154980 RepID=UPI00344746BB